MINYAQPHASSTGPAFTLHLQRDPPPAVAPERSERPLSFFSSHSSTGFVSCTAAGCVLLVLNFNNQASDFLSLKDNTPNC